MERRYAGNRLRSFGTRPLCDVPAAAFITKPAPRITQRTRTCILCLWGGGAARELITQACRGALVVLGSPFVKQRRAGERHLSFDVRPLVQRASCGLQHQASAACHSAHAHLHSLSLGRRRRTRAHYTSAPWRSCCARKSFRRTMPCRREASFFRRAASGATCQLRSSTLSQRRVSLSAGAPDLSVSGKEAQHASLLLARLVAGWLCW